MAAGGGRLIRSCFSLVSDRTPIDFSKTQFPFHCNWANKGNLASIPYTRHRSCRGPCNTTFCLFSSILKLDNPTPTHSPSNDPRRPPHAPNHKFGPNTLRNPPLRQLCQHSSQPLLSIPPDAHRVSGSHRRKRRQNHASHTSEDPRICLPHERERSGQEAEHEC